MIDLDDLVLIVQSIEMFAACVWYFHCCSHHVLLSLGSELVLRAFSITSLFPMNNEAVFISSFV